jgi:hypothetical protein
VFQRFTERARQVVVFAQDEARALWHNYIGTEHLLLGLLREEQGVAAAVLASLGVGIEETRAKVAEIVGMGESVTGGQTPFTPRAKKVLELSLREAMSLGRSYIATVHILLGLVSENDGVAARVLLDFGADAPTVRTATTRLVSRPGPSAGGLLPPAGSLALGHRGAAAGGLRHRAPLHPTQTAADQRQSRKRSSKPSSANGPTASPTPQAPTAPEPSPATSAGTTTTDRTAHSAAARQSAASQRSVGPTARPGSSGSRCRAGTR